MKSGAGRPAELLAVFAAALIIWQVCISLGHVPPYLMASPGAAAHAFWQNWPHILRALGLTLRNALLGLALAACSAIALAALVSTSRGLLAAIMPPLLVLRTAPTLAVMPLLIIMFGRGMRTALLVVCITSFFPVFIAALRGMNSVGEDMLELMHQLAAPGWFVMLKLRLPASMAFIGAALRASITAAVLTAMLTEWLSGAPGIGALILTASSSRMTPLVWAILCVTVLTNVTLTQGMVWLERRMRG